MSPSPASSESAPEPPPGPQPSDHLGPHLDSHLDSHLDNHLGLGSAPSAWLEYLPRIGLEPGQLPAIFAAESYSRARLHEARALAGALASPAWRGCAVYALGSLGREEASPQSDLDLAFVYDGEAIDAGAAASLRTELLARLAPSFDAPQKTFARAVDLRALTRNIGGHEDTNETLTYRALLLTEGVWVAGAGRSFKRALFAAYAAGQISRGRFLTALGNDLHRYYRTLCMDYRYKVEELDKSWAIRVLKLRHSRKLWHLANIALQCWAVEAIEDDDQRDVVLASRISWPSLLRLCVVLDHFDALELAREPLLCFDRFLAALARAEVREELGALAHAERNHSQVYTELHQNAERLDLATAEIVELLFTRCRAFLVRFCLL